MSVKIRAAARGKPSDPNYPVRYHPVPVSRGTVTLRDLAERAAAVSTVSSIDLVAAV